MTHDLRRRVSGVLLLSLAVLGLSHSPSASLAAPADDEVRGQVVDRAGVGQRPAGGVRRWPGKTITYAESLPAKWDPSLQLALQAWNSSGGKLKFKKASPAKAQLSIGYGPTQGFAGFATIGPNKNAYVHLSTGFKNVDATIEQRLGVGRLLTHELGHVVGFGHVGKGCQLMVTFIPATCQLLSFEPGYRVCRWIDKSLLKSFIAAYGGKGKLAPKLCPIDPLAPQLQNVAFSGGAAAGQPVRVTWKPQPAKPGERVRIWVRAGACPRDVEGFSPDQEVFLGPTAGVWTDPNPQDVLGSHCFRVSVINRSDGEQPAFTRVLGRFVQIPAAPVVSNIVYDGFAGWSFEATWPTGTSLVALRWFGNQPGCPTPGDEFETFLDVGGLYLDGTEDECIAFVSETGTGVRSARATYTFDVP